MSRLRTALDERRRVRTRRAALRAIDRAIASAPTRASVEELRAVATRVDENGGGGRPPGRRRYR